MSLVFLPISIFRGFLKVPDPPKKILLRKVHITDAGAVKGTGITKS